jgi:uncharacterized protein (UPF0332 family)
VKPETALYLEKAATLLSEAGAIFTIHLHEAAGRTTYLAGFHAAQAFIFENTGRTPKTHSGVLREFLRLTKTIHGFRPISGFFFPRTITSRPSQTTKLDRPQGCRRN